DRVDLVIDGHAQGPEQDTAAGRVGPGGRPQAVLDIVLYVVHVLDEGVGQAVEAGLEADQRAVADLAVFAAKLGAGAVEEVGRALQCLAAPYQHAGRPPHHGLRDRPRLQPEHRPDWVVERVVDAEVERILPAAERPERLERVGHGHAGGNQLPV